MLGMAFCFRWLGQYILVNYWAQSGCVKSANCGYNAPLMDCCILARTKMTFVTMPKSGTLALNEESRRLAGRGRTVYRFGFGESPFPPPRHVQKALRKSTFRKDYTTVAGLPELRARIADFHSEADGYAINAEQVLVAPGSKPLLLNCMQAFEHAEVYLPAPAYVSYAAMAKLARHPLIRIQTSYDTRWRITSEALDAAIIRHSQPGREKVLALNYPGNPDGLTYSRAELQALAATLRRHDVWALSDEIYALLHHQGRHVSLASIYPERTLVSTGLSKWCGAGGWRLGALILPASAPAELRDALIGLGSEVYSCAPTPVQVAALAAYQLDKRTHRFLRAQRQILSGIGGAVHRALLAAGVKAHAAEGGFYLLCDFSGYADSLRKRDIQGDTALCARLLAETGVALLPGSKFGLPAEALTARLAYVDFDGAAALSSQRAKEGILPHAEKMLTGIAALDSWLN
ncbi:MAG: aminotransferase class I/II-fold pyridoxal phosphate-dependent enzyme [Chloroflexi bacterium]|nr:aminotransferase class I/II-fold pyridoxal phosphate-dependent enzyme [Chloroflexota bacterium]